MFRLSEKLQALTKRIQLGYDIDPSEYQEIREISPPSIPPAIWKSFEDAIVMYLGRTVYPDRLLPIVLPLLDPSLVLTLNAPGIDLTSVDLSNRTFSRCNFECADFRNANLQGTKFTESILTESLFTREDMMKNRPRFMPLIRAGTSTPPYVFGDYSVFVNLEEETVDYMLLDQVTIKGGIFAEEFSMDTTGTYIVRVENNYNTPYQVKSTLVENPVWSAVSSFDEKLPKESQFVLTSERISEIRAMMTRKGIRDILISMRPQNYQKDRSNSRFKIYPHSRGRFILNDMQSINDIQVSSGRPVIQTLFSISNSFKKYAFTIVDSVQFGKYAICSLAKSTNDAIFIVVHCETMRIITVFEDLFDSPYASQESPRISYFDQGKTYIYDVELEREIGTFSEKEFLNTRLNNFGNLFDGWFSKDMTRIAFVGKNGIVIQGMDGKETHKICIESTGTSMVPIKLFDEKICVLIESSDQYMVVFIPYDGFDHIVRFTNFTDCDMTNVRGLPHLLVAELDKPIQKPNRYTIDGTTWIRRGDVDLAREIIQEMNFNLQEIYASPRSLTITLEPISNE